MRPFAPLLLNKTLNLFVVTKRFTLTRSNGNKLLPIQLLVGNSISDPGITDRFRSIRKCSNLADILTVLFQLKKSLNRWVTQCCASAFGNTGNLFEGQRLVSKSISD